MLRINWKVLSVAAVLLALCLLPLQLLPPALQLRLLHRVQQLLRRRLPRRRLRQLLPQRQLFRLRLLQPALLLLELLLRRPALLPRSVLLLRRPRLLLPAPARLFLQPLLRLLPAPVLPVLRLSPSRPTGHCFGAGRTFAPGSSFALNGFPLRIERPIAAPPASAVSSQGSAG